MTPSRETVASNVRRIRRAQGMTQQQLAEAVGVAQSQICDIERAKYDVRSDTIDRLAEALETAPATFFIPVEESAEKSVATMVDT